MKDRNKIIKQKLLGGSDSTAVGDGGGIRCGNPFQTALRPTFSLHTQLNL